MVQSFGLKCKVKLAAGDPSNAAGAAFSCSKVLVRAVSGKTGRFPCSTLTF
jgi:hypothetical protein